MMWAELNNRVSQMNDIAADKKQKLSVIWAELNHTAVKSRRRIAVGRMKLSQMLTCVMGWMRDRLTMSQMLIDVKLRQMLTCVTGRIREELMLSQMMTYV